MKENPFIEIRNLSVNYETDNIVVNAVSEINLTVNRGEAVGLVGETGAGKSTTALSIIRLLPKRVGKIISGEILMDGKDLLNLPEATMRLIRGEKISMIFQDPMTSLNPILTIEDQIAEVFKLHTAMTRDEILQAVNELLEMVGIQAERKKDYPHQFSGGMKQRAVIAMALAGKPGLLIADEPTTALDVTIQAQVLAMIKDLQKKMNTAMILISHDLGVVAQACSKVAVMYAGEIVEFGTAEDIYESESHHPYTEGLFGSLPDINSDAKRLMPIEGLMPDPTNLPTGCKFHPRCPKRMSICEHEKPKSVQIGNHVLKCHLFNSN